MTPKNLIKLSVDEVELIFKINIYKGSSMTDIKGIHLSLPEKEYQKIKNKELQIINELQQKLAVLGYNCKYKNNTPKRYNRDKLRKKIVRQFIFEINNN